MNTLKFNLLFFILIFFNICQSQTGPGGVGTDDGSSDLVIWYRPDNGIIASGTNVSSWLNSAGYTPLNLVQNGTTFPQLLAGSVNGYSEIQFNTVGILQSGTGLNGTNFIVNQASSYIHLKANSITNSFPYIALGASTRFLCHVPWGNSTVYFDIGTCCGTSARVQVPGLSGLNNYSLWNFDALAFTGKQLYRNGTPIANEAGTSTFIPHSTSRFQLGRNFDGNITEVIVFKTKVNTAERLIIQNYISAKYNQALASGDIYTQDDAIMGEFDHNVAGIGQATDGSNHTDSQGTGIIRINNPTELANDEFMFWGEETINPTYNFTTNTATYTEQLNSRWRISKRNDVGRVDISFDISGIDLSGKQSCSSLQLIFDNDYDFSSPNEIYDLTIAGSTASVTNAITVNNRYFTLRYKDQIVWNGTNYFNGSGAANAPDNTNSCLKFTVKPGAASTLTFNAHVREIEVETRAVLNVNNGVLLEAEDAILIDGTIHLLGEAQLIQNHTGTTSNSGSGSLTKRQQGVSNFYNYNYWSAPVNLAGNWQPSYLEDAAGVVTFSAANNANASTSPITLSTRWLYAFNGTSDNYYEWIKISSTTNLLPGVGYTMKGSGATTANQEYIFRGIPNDGDYSHLVTAGNDFLTGNPYPSALNANQFIADNSSVIDGTLYFWEQFTTNNNHYLRDYQGGHAIYNLMSLGIPATADASGLTSGSGSASKPAPTQYIPPGQGFFVIAQNTGNIIFNNGQRFFARESLGESVFFKTTKGKEKVSVEDTRTKIWFSFTKPDVYTKFIGLGYDANTTYGYDNGYDALVYDKLRNDMSWALNDKKLAIQALPEIKILDELSLNTKINDAGVYNFSISKMTHVPDDLEIYLKDNIHNIYYNLREADADLFLNSKTKSDQFSIVFQNDTTLETIDFNENFKILTTYDLERQILNVHLNEKLNAIKSFTVYNSLGQEVMHIKSPTTPSIPVEKLSSGIYILEIDADYFKNLKRTKFLKY